MSTTKKVATPCAAECNTQGKTPGKTRKIRKCHYYCEGPILSCGSCDNNICTRHRQYATVMDSPTPYSVCAECTDRLHHQSKIFYRAICCLLVLGFLMYYFFPELKVEV